MHPLRLRELLCTHACKCVNYKPDGKEASSNFPLTKIVGHSHMLSLMSQRSSQVFICKCPATHNHKSFELVNKHIILNATGNCSWESVSKKSSSQLNFIDRGIYLLHSKCRDQPCAFHDSTVHMFVAVSIPLDRSPRYSVVLGASPQGHTLHLGH